MTKEIKPIKKAARRVKKAKEPCKACSGTGLKTIYELCPVCEGSPLK